MWTIPAERMKMEREHWVPLSKQALAILENLPRLADNPLVFPALRGGLMRDSYTGALMREMHAQTPYLDPVSGLPAVPHGLRATFRQWCAEQNYPREIAETALAHQTGNAVERSYQRSDVLERRRVLMQAWSDYLHGDTEQAANVVSIHG